MTEQPLVDLQQVARNLLLGAIPERAGELQVLWDAYGPEFQLVEDDHPDGPIILDAGIYKFVRFNHRMMRLFWLAGHALWEGFEAFQRFAEGGAARLERLNTIVGCFDQTMIAKDVDHVPWPVGVPKPGVLVEHVEGDPGRVAGEIAILSAAFAVLHELRHLAHQNEGTSAPYDNEVLCREEEHSCDEFAVGYLLERIDDYVANTGEQAQRVLEKRQIGVYAALFALALLIKNRPGETKTHPSTQDRLNRVIRQMNDSSGLTKKASVVAMAAFCSLQLLRYKDAATPLRSEEFVAKVLEWSHHIDLAYET